MQCTSLVVIIPQLKLPEGISLPIDIPIEEVREEQTDHVERC